LIPDEKVTPGELREALQQTLASQGWQEAILPKLRLRLQVARSQLETSTNYEELRSLQVEIRLLREIVERPEAMFKP
jgi:hypothetical protein